MTDTTQAVGLDDLLTTFERLSVRKGELLERCNGRGWPEKESDEFHKIRDEQIPTLRTQISAALAAQVVPAGWKLVPVEPTEEMVQDVYLNASVTGLDDFAIKDIWDAMLAASPAPAEAKEEQRAAAERDMQLLGTGFLVDGQRVDPSRVMMLRASTPQPQAAQPVAWAVYWGLPPTRKNSVHFEKATADEVAARIKSATDVRPLYTAAPALTEEQIARAVRPLYASDEAAQMGLADDIATVRAALRSTQGGDHEA